MDFLLVPTAPTHYTREQVEAEPVEANTRLGRYTNFVNLMDLAALAVPSGRKDNGLPFGVTFIAPAFTEGRLASLGAAYHFATGLALGATSHPVPAPAYGGPADPPPSDAPMRLAVAGLHLSGQPLNHQLLELGARLVGNP